MSPRRSCRPASCRAGALGAAVAATLLALAAPSASAAQLSLVVDSGSARYKPIVAALERDLGEANTVKVHNMTAIDSSNPLAKGRFLARIASADLIIPIGARSSQFVADELEDSPAFFVGGETLRGSYLAHAHVTGILAYSPEETVAVAKDLLPDLKAIGVLFTPGYEGVVARMRSAAAEEGVTIVSRSVRTRKDIGPAAREVTKDAGLLWVTADPLLVQDVIFSYLVQESLRMKRPLTSPAAALVERGGLYATIPDIDRLTAAASTALSAVLAGSRPAGESRVLPGPRNGPVLVNRSLADKLGIRVPSSLRLWTGGAVD